MRRKIVAAVALTLLLLMVRFPSVPAAWTFKPIPNKNWMRVASISEPETVDPHKAYDTASAQLIINVYDTLIFFNRERLIEYEYHIAESGEQVNETTYVFKIREGAKWQNATYGNVTKEDVEYSFERGMVSDYIGGAMWMFYEPLTGYSGSAFGPWNLSDTSDVADLGHIIDDAIESFSNFTGDYVQFNLAIPYGPFMQILSQSWSAIIDYEWSTAQGAWPGSGVAFADRWNVGTNYVDWRNYNQRYNSSVPVTFDNGGGVAGNHVMMGSGPYEFVSWTVGTSWDLTKFDDYVLGWPAAGAAKYVTNVTMNLVASWPIRKVNFLKGNVDLAYVPRQFIGDIEGEPGIRGVKDLPMLALDSMHFNYNVSATNTTFTLKPKLGGVEKLDLLSDIHMRKALAHSFDFATFITSAYLDEAEQPATPAIKGLTYNWEALNKTAYDYDLAEAKDEFKRAFGGSVASPGPAWTDGFTLPIVCNDGNLAREMAAYWLEYIIESLILWPLGVAVDIKVFPFQAWGSMFIPALVAGELPVFLAGWLGDFADVHNFMMPYMHTGGYFAGFQSVQYGQSGWTQKATIADPFNPGVTVNLTADIGAVPGASINNTYVDSLIELGIEKTVEGERRAIYNEVQDIFLAEMPSLPLAQPTGRYWERDWVQGWYYNPLYGGSVAAGFGSTAPADSVLYFYHLWKGLDSDINGDDYVDIFDAALLSAHWHSPPFPDGPLGYSRKADIFPLSELDGSGYKTEGADGKVNILDASLINAQWHDWA